MSGETLRKVRKQRGWTQGEVGVRLGVSQAYVALLEKGRRRMPDDLVRKAVREFRLSPVLLPMSRNSAPSSRHSAKGNSKTKDPSTTLTMDAFSTGQSAVGAYKRQSREAARPGNEQQKQNEKLARHLSRLGYPGFAYMRGGWMKNPSEVLLTALAQSNLDSRLAEALPWLLLHYSDLNSDWLVREARGLNLTNRLGFVVDLARRVLEKGSETNSPRYLALTRLSETLSASRLAAEDTFGQESLTETERNWLRANRPQEAEFWNVLTNWQPEFLQYTL